VASRALKSGDVVDESTSSLIRSLSVTAKVRQIQSWKMLQLVAWGLERAAEESTP
jgi:hypothetical protein